MAKIARCSCGGLQADVSGEPDAVVVCHCTDCQRRTGSVTAAGRDFHEHFCPTDFNIFRVGAIPAPQNRTNAS